MDMSTCTPLELTLLDDFLSIADAQGFGVATGESVAAVLQEGVGLDLRVLADIWAIVDPDSKGYLVRDEVAALLRIIGWVQEGAQLTPELIHQSGPCAVITHPLMPHRERETTSSPSAAPAAASSPKGKDKEDPDKPFQPLSPGEMEVISQTTHDPIHCERAMRSLMDLFTNPEFDPDLITQGLNVLAVCLGTGSDQVGNYWRIHLDSFGLLIQTMDDATDATPEITAIRPRLVEIIELLLDEQKLAHHRTKALQALEESHEQPVLSPVVESRPSPSHDRPAPPSHQNTSDLIWEEDQAYEAALRRITHGGPPPPTVSDRSAEASRIASQATSILDLLKVQSEQDNEAAALEEALKASKLALEANRILVELHEHSRAAAEEEELELALRLSREEEEKNSYRFYDSSRTPSPWQRPANAQTSSYFPNDVKHADSPFDPSPFDDTFSISRTPSPNPVELPVLPTLPPISPPPIPPPPPISRSAPQSPIRDDPPMSPLRRESARASIPVPTPPRVNSIPPPPPPLISFEDLSSDPAERRTSSPENPAAQEFADSIPQSHSRQPSPPPGSNSEANPGGQPSHDDGGLRPEVSRRPESPAGGDEPPPPYDPGY